MTETTSHETELTRAETASLLRSLADSLDDDATEVRIAVGNKNVRLSPPEQIQTAVTVTERSRRIRKDVETLGLEFNWHPRTTDSGAASQRTAGSDAEANR